MAELGEALGQGTPARPTRSQRQRLPGGGGGGSTDGWGEHAAAGSALHATSMAASSAASSSVAGEAGGGQDAGDEDSEAVYERQNPEEVLGRLPKDWAAKVLKASKWQDKKELLDKLLAITAGPRLAAADYSEVPCGERARKPLLCLCFAFALPLVASCRTCGASACACSPIQGRPVEYALTSARPQVVKSLRVLTGDSMVLVVVSAIKALGTPALASLSSLPLSPRCQHPLHAARVTASGLGSMRAQERRGVHCCRAAQQHRRLLPGAAARCACVLVYRARVAAARRHRLHAARLQRVKSTETHTPHHTTQATRKRVRKALVERNRCG